MKKVGAAERQSGDGTKFAEVRWQAVFVGGWRGEVCSKLLPSAFFPFSFSFTLPSPPRNLLKEGKSILRPSSGF